MKQYSKIIVGMDVHKETIVNAVLPMTSDKVTERITIENTPQAIGKMVKRLTAQSEAEFVYEAGPCGYEVQREITKMKYKCVVIAPGLIPVRPGDRVKTDRRDAEKLARLYRAGELTEIRVPTRQEEADRDLVRAREGAMADRLRCRHRLLKFLLRQGLVYHETRTWGVEHRAWLKTHKFEWPALQQTFEAHMRALDETEARMETLNHQLQDLAQTESYRIPVQYLRCLKGIDTLSALTLMVETQDFRRFKSAREYMSMTGLVASEYSSGNKVKRGGITKAGNAHLRRVLVESAWCCRNRYAVNRALAERRKGCPKEVVQIARKAQDRLHRKFCRMIARNKAHQVTVTATARELSGFVWSIAQHFPLKAAA